MKNIEELEAEVRELREELKKTNEKIDILLGTNEGKTAIILTKKKKYSIEEIWQVRQKTSLSKAAAILGVSKSTVQRACREYNDKYYGEI